MIAQRNCGVRARPTALLTILWIGLCAWSVPLATGCDDDPAAGERQDGGVDRDSGNDLLDVGVTDSDQLEDLDTAHEADADAKGDADANGDATGDPATDAAADTTPDTGLDSGGGDAADARGASFLDTYPITGTHPEGGAYDGTDHAFYFGSLGDGSVRRIDARTGTESVIYTPTEDGTWWTLGMDVDDANRLLWVCAMDDQTDNTEDDPPYDGYVWVFDLDTDERVATYDLSDAFATATCTDVAVDAEGIAYVVDREHPNIYRIDDEGVSLFTSDEQLSGSLVGQNGAVVLPDQSALLVIVYFDPALVRVDLDTGDVARVDILGTFADATLLAGADGLALHEGDAWVAFRGELVRVRPESAAWTHATQAEADVTVGMTDVISTPNGLYLLNGQAVRFALNQETDPFQLVRFDGTVE